MTTTVFGHPKKERALQKLTNANNRAALYYSDRFIGNRWIF